MKEMTQRKFGTEHYRTSGNASVSRRSPARIVQFNFCSVSGLTQEILCFLRAAACEMELVKSHWTREQVGDKVVKLNHIPTAEMLRMFI